tara:strand:+ start:2533 stop:2907 length:375 start_codon:yes stop_codon:yes gene_type:complete
MFIVVDTSSGIPVYRQIMDQVRFHIASGLLEPGDAIPSTRNLSATLGVTSMTISKAFSLLEAEGLLERRPGLPLVVKGRASDLVAASKLEQLRTALAPVVTMTRQLNIDNQHAAELFKELLEDS